jgi:membrane-associated HD superfamily phosphohydrolase
MIDFFKRSELVRRGLASGKLRRRRARNGLLRGLEYSWGMKGVLFAGLHRWPGCAHLSAATSPSQRKNFVIALLFFLIALMMLWVNQPRTFSQNSRILLVFGVMLVQLALTKFIYVPLQQQVCLRLQTDMAELLTPFALAPLLLSVLLGRNHGLYAAVFVSLWSSVLFGKIDAPLLVTGMISGFTACLPRRLQVRRRSKLVRAGLGVGVGDLDLVAHIRFHRPDQSLSRLRQMIGR